MSREGAGWTEIVRRRLVSAFTQRLGLKLSSLFLALVLWIVASVEEPTVATIPVRVIPELERTRLDAPPAAVMATVTGRGREVLKLLRTPPVLRVVASAEDGDSVIRSIAPGDVDLPVGMQALVRDIRPQQIVLHLIPDPRPARASASSRPRDSSLALVDSVGLPATTLARLDSVRIDSAAHALIRRDSVRRDSLRKDSLRTDSVRRSFRRDSVRDTAHRAIPRRDSLRRPVVPSEQSP